MQGTVPSGTEMQQHWGWTMVPMKNQVHSYTGDKNTPRKWHFSLQRWTLCIYSSIYSCTQDTVKIKKYVEYTEKKTTKGILLLGMWNDPQNTENTWCSRISTEKSSTMNICISTTSLRLAADRHSSSSCQNFLGDTSFTRCALGGPLHVTPHTFATESSSDQGTSFSPHSQLPPHRIPAFGFIHLSLPQSSVSASECHGCTVTFILSDTQQGLKPHCSPLPWPWALTPESHDLDRENMAHRRINWSGCQH